MNRPETHDAVDRSFYDAVTDNNMAHLRGDKEITALFNDGLRQLDISLSVEKVGKLARYAAELYKWNQRINLVARKTGMPDIIEIHFLDSLTLLPFFPETGQAGTVLLDVGTGAGFPGLVLAVVRPKLRVILLEPRLKRISFLNHVKRLLKLDNVEVIGSRLEDADTLGAENIDWVTCRALTEPQKFLFMVAPFMERGARALLMLGPGAEVGIAKQLPGRCFVETRKDVVLPRSGAKRTLLAVKSRGK